ncbi:DUF5819 family protein [Streptomyces sp. NPDC055134]
MDAYDKGSTARRSDLEPQPVPEPGPSRSPAPSHEPDPNHVPEPDPASPPLAPPPPSATPRIGLSALSLRYQIAAACALVVIALGACVHVAMVFLHVSPPNTVSKEYGGAVDSWIYPEFEQNWKLFAPNPLQQNIAVQARAEIRTADGGTRTTGWYDLSAQDGADIDGNLLPSHTQQNELRRAWDFYVSAHDSENRPNGLRGQLSERYIRRIVVLRLSHDDGLTAAGKAAAGKAAAGEKATIARVQVRSRTTNVVPPPWSDEKVDSKPLYREVPWWTVTVTDRALDSNSQSESRDGTGTRARAATDGTDAR